MDRALSDLTFPMCIRTLIASGSNSWIENYLSWITDDSKVIEACCRLDENDTFIGSSGTFEDTVVFL